MDTCDAIDLETVVITTTSSSCLSWTVLRGSTPIVRTEYGTCRKPPSSDMCPLRAIWVYLTIVSCPAFMALSFTTYLLCLYMTFTQTRDLSRDDRSPITSTSCAHQRTPVYVSQLVGETPSPCTVSPSYIQRQLPPSTISPSWRSRRALDPVVFVQTKRQSKKIKPMNKTPLLISIPFVVRIIQNTRMRS